MSDADAYYGEIRLFAGLRVPRDWHFCDGSLLPISGNEALYSLIGTAYGGDGVTNFALPDLRGRVAVGQGQGPGLKAYTVGSTGGTEGVTLAEAQMPVHTHVINVSSTVANTATPGPAVTFGAQTEPSRFYINAALPSSGTRDYSALSVTTDGEGTAHANLMPSRVLNYMICLNGLYPNFG